MKRPLSTALMMYYAMGGGDIPLPKMNTNNKPQWYKIHLPKSVRKGLSYEEQQELKKNYLGGRINTCNYFRYVINYHHTVFM